MAVSRVPSLPLLVPMADLVCSILAQKCIIGVTRERAGEKWVGRRGNGGKVPLGQLFLMMSVGCMQREVQIGRRRAEIFAQNLKNKPAPPRPMFQTRTTGPERFRRS